MDRWIGVDLDGTLAEYHGWKGASHIGEPIEPMKERVLKWVAEGKTVKIFTARACVSTQIPPIGKWLKLHGFPEFEITNIKDYGMVELWDDRCVQVEPNEGTRVLEGGDDS